MVATQIFCWFIGWFIGWLKHGGTVMVVDFFVSDRM